MKKEPIVRLTKKDFRIDWFSGSGAGGQKRNKVKNCCRIHHDESGTMAVCQDHREGPKNLKEAFTRLTSSKEFRNWLQLETARRLGKAQTIEEAVEYEIRNNTTVEVIDENGNWVNEK